jgi:hypothetical protein
MTTVFWLPQSALEWVLFLAIALSALCLVVLGTMLIVHKGLAMQADRAVRVHSVLVTLLIGIAAATCWYAVLATWTP